MTDKNKTIYDIKINPPIGRVGAYAVESFTVNQKEAEWANLRSAISFGGGGGRDIEPGTYFRLIRGNSVGTFGTDIVMSDVPAERSDLYEVFRRATGSVLINGLGLGLVVESICQKEEVTDVTVIEISEEVIKLVGDYYLKRYKKKLNIIHADALLWTPPKGKRYNIVWNDIWDNICSDNLKDMHTLHRKYGRRSNWVGSWCRWQCEAQR